MSKYIFTSESVTEGHPDKVADKISDAILDAYLEKDPNARVAAETVLKNNTVILAGEIGSEAEIDTEKVVRNVINNIGYDHSELGFDGHTAEIINLLDKQSPDIAQGVDSALEVRDEHGDEIGAGDQGIIFGYAVNETPELLPLPISLAHKLAYRLTEVRKNGTLKYLRPDGKTQVSVIYEDGKAVGIDTILISTQHDENATQEQLRNDLIENVIKPIISEEWLNDEVKILVNPTGRFVIGGPVGDSGLTGRKIIVDTYGGAAHHGGGAFSGKDSTKVDRSAAYAARWAAKNIVAADLAERAEIQLAYAIGVAAPVSIYVNTFGTGVLPDEEIQAAVSEVFDFTPRGIIRELELRKPVFAATAAYGHFGRPDTDFSWERTNKVSALKKALIATVKAK